MGMPSLNIRFATTAAEVAKRATRGIVMIILRGAVPQKNPLNLQDASEVPTSVSAANRDYINMIFKGNEFSPKGVYAYFLAQDAAIDEALSWAAKQSIDYIVMPTAETDGVSEQIMNWVTGQKQHIHSKLHYKQHYLRQQELFGRAVYAEDCRHYLRHGYFPLRYLCGAARGYRLHKNEQA